MFELPHELAKNVRLRILENQDISEVIGFDDEYLTGHSKDNFWHFYWKSQEISCKTFHRKFVLLNFMSLLTIPPKWLVALTTPMPIEITIPLKATPPAMHIPLRRPLFFWEACYPQHLVFLFCVLNVIFVPFNFIFPVVHWRPDEGTFKRLYCKFVYSIFCTVD